MKKLVALLLASLVASTAFAGLDTDTNMLGMYFDTQGEVVCTTAAFLSHVPAYILYTNPSIPSTRGFECSISKTAGNSSIAWTFPIPATNVGAGTSLIVGYSVPILTSAATVMAIADIFFLDFIPVDFFMGPSSPSSPGSNGLPMVMLEDFSLITVGTSVLDGACAQINGLCTVVENEDASFGAVKALFR